MEGDSFLGLTQRREDAEKRVEKEDGREHRGRDRDVGFTGYFERLEKSIGAWRQRGDLG
jgi:hypothetical protein